VAQWWLSHLVIIAGQAHSTVSLVPSHLIPDTVLPSAEIHQTQPPRPCWRSALRWCLFFFLKGSDESWALQSFQASKLICVWAATEAAIRRECMAMTCSGSHDHLTFVPDSCLIHMGGTSRPTRVFLRGGITENTLQIKCSWFCVHQISFLMQYSFTKLKPPATQKHINPNVYCPQRIK